MTSIYVYAVMLLFKAGQPMTSENIEKVVSAAGMTPDTLRCQRMANSIKNININDIIATLVVAARADAAQVAPAPSEKKAEPVEQKDEIAEGLTKLFGE